MSALCDYCAHSRAVHSENGVHFVCTFSAKKAGTLLANGAVLQGTPREKAAQRRQRGGQMNYPKIWTDDEVIEITNPNDLRQIEKAMRFKAEHIKAKADPEVFAIAADLLDVLYKIVVLHWSQPNENQ